MSANTRTENAASASPPPGSLNRLPVVLALTGLGRTAWLDLVREGKAPRPIKIGRAALWPRNEIDAWIAERIRDSRAESHGASPANERKGGVK